MIRHIPGVGRVDTSPKTKKPKKPKTPKAKKAPKAKKPKAKKAKKHRVKRNAAGRAVNAKGKFIKER